MCLLGLAAAVSDRSAVADPVHGVWTSLVAGKRTWRLINYNIRDDPNEDDAVIVENYDLRRVGRAAVARLRWTTSWGENVGDREHLPQQVAVIDGRVWWLPLEASDDDVVRAIRKMPTFSERPSDVAPTRKSKWKWVLTTSGAQGTLICIGHMQPRGEECEDTCSGMVCFSPKDGIVAIEGTASPNFEYYAMRGHADLK